MSELNDKLMPLLASTVHGNQAAFEELYQATASRLFALCLTIVKRKDWAEDILQDAFIKIWHHASDYHAEKGSVYNWMVCIVRYRALDYLRRGDNKLELHDDITDLKDKLTKHVTPEHVLQSDKLALDKCLQQLSEDQRQSIVMAFFHGLTHDDLAEKLSKPLGTIKSWVRRGLTSLKRCLDI